MKMRVDEQKA